MEINMENNIERTSGTQGWLNVFWGCETVKERKKRSCWAIMEAKMVVDGCLVAMETHMVVDGCWAVMETIVVVAGCWAVMETIMVVDGC